MCKSDRYHILSQLLVVKLKGFQFSSPLSVRSDFGHLRSVDILFAITFFYLLQKLGVVVSSREKQLSLWSTISLSSSNFTSKYQVEN